jgi:hypothetical protein
MTKNLFLSWVKWWVVSVALVSTAGRVSAQLVDIQECQILDNPAARPVYQVGIAYVAESEFGEGEDSGIFEMEADWYFAHFRDILYGDIDLSLAARTLFLADSAGLQLPDQLVKLALDAGWTWRYTNGMGLQVRAAPGIYSDLEEFAAGALAVPFSVAVTRAFTPEMSGIAGFEIRPDFDRVLMPILGIEWQAFDEFRVKARIPESRVTWFISRDWSAHLGFEWRDTTYDLREKGDFDRKSIALEEFRLSLGAGFRVSDQLEVVGAIGRSVGRKVIFDRVESGFDEEVDVEDATYIHFGLVGPF